MAVILARIGFAVRKEVRLDCLGGVTHKPEDTCLI